tara:strand:+ start:139 stop:609 length:471 start_codon:yes stop_codon:yes gene_type:complete
MTIHVVGHSRGLGEFLYQEFEKNRYIVRGYSRTNNYDLEKDACKICYQVEDDDIVILNAHANGSQIEYIERLRHTDCRIVVMGSIASTQFDPTMPEYSIQKHTLEHYVEEISLHNKLPILYLKLTGSSYKNYNLIYNSIKLWINNPEITQIGYSVL